MAYKNIHLHNEIRSWTTEQLIETLEFNGLGECCDAISIKQIDGEEFLNLSEGQLSLWRNVLNLTQTRRLWSVIQLAKERPKDFVIHSGQLTQSKKPAPSQQQQQQQNIPTVPAVLPTKPNDMVQQKQPIQIRNKVPLPIKPVLPKPPQLNPSEQRFPAKEDTNSSPTLNRSIVTALQAKINSEFPPPATPNKPPLTLPVEPVKLEANVPNTVSSNIGSDRKVKSPFAANLNNLLSQQLAVKEDQSSPVGIEGNYPKHVLQRKLSVTSTSSTDSLPLPPKPPSRQPSPVPVEPATLLKNPSAASFRPPEILPNSSHLHTLPKARSVDRPPMPRPPMQSHVSTVPDHFGTMPRTRTDTDSGDFIAPPLPTRPMENPPNPLSQLQQQQLSPANLPLLYPNVTITTLANPRPIQQPPAWTTSRPLPSPPKNDSPFVRPAIPQPVKNDISANLGRKSPNCCDNLPRPPNLALPPVHIDVDFELEDEDAEYYFVDEERQSTDYKEQAWYKYVERKDAHMLLLGKPNGCFLVRPSRKDEHECCFSVICNRRVYNIAVSKQGNKFLMGKSTFDTIQDIVERFTMNPLVLNGPNNEDLLVTLRRS